MIDVDKLAQEIRRVDGNHSLGAAALAEALLPFLSSHLGQNTSEITVAAKGEFEIVSLGTKGACGMTRITPDGWWLKLKPGIYKITASPEPTP